MSLICSLSKLREKEVINTENGEKLGFIDDIEFDAENERIAAFVIFGRKRFCGLLGRDSDLVITCQEIKLVGKDTVLVRINSNECEKSTKSHKFRIENLLNRMN